MSGIILSAHSLVHGSANNLYYQTGRKKMSVRIKLLKIMSKELGLYVIRKVISVRIAFAYNCCITLQGNTPKVVSWLWAKSLRQMILRNIFLHLELEALLISTSRLLKRKYWCIKHSNLLHGIGLYICDDNLKMLFLNYLYIVNMVHTFNTHNYHDFELCIFVYL